MTKHQVKKNIFKYLRQHAIPYGFSNNEGNKTISFDLTDVIYLQVYMPNIVGKFVETCVRFSEDSLYCQTYYCRPVVDVELEKQAVRAERIVNHLNMNLTYDCNYLYEHTFIYDEFNGDIFNGCLMRYSVLCEYFQASMDYILNFSVQQLMDVCLWNWHSGEF